MKISKFFSSCKKFFLIPNFHSRQSNSHMLVLLNIMFLGFLTAAASNVFAVTGSGGSSAGRIPPKKASVKPAAMTKTASDAINWNGFYLGGMLGEAWGRTAWQFTNANSFNTSGVATVGTDFNFSETNFAGGALAGLNRQMGRLVLGVEGSVLGLSFNQNQASPFFPARDVYTSTLRFITTARGRAGIAMSRWLAYFTGGWAGGDLSLTLQNNVSGVRAESTQWANGWTVGTGIDCKVTKNVALGVAYDYVRLNMSNRNMSCRFCGAGAGTPVINAQERLQSVVARLSFYFSD